MREATAGQSPPVPLNTVPAVAGIVERFSKALLKRFSQIDSEFTTEHFDKWLQFECLKLNSLFLGNDTALANEFIRSEWNAPAHLGHAVQLARYIDGDPANSVFVACYGTAADMLSIVAEKPAEAIDEWGWMLQALAETLMANLLGFRDGMEEMYDPACEGVPVTSADFEAFFAEQS